MYFLYIVRRWAWGNTSTAFGRSSYSFFFWWFLSSQNTFSSRVTSRTGRQKIMLGSLSISSSSSKLTGANFLTFFAFFLRTLSKFVKPCTVEQVYSNCPSFWEWMNLGILSKMGTFIYRACNSWKIQSRWCWAISLLTVTCLIFYWLIDF